MGDQYSATAGSDTISGLAGDDTLVGGGGAVTVEAAPNASEAPVMEHLLGSDGVESLMPLPWRISDQNCQEQCRL